MMSEYNWIKAQGECCIAHCHDEPVVVDIMDNVFCEECAEQNQTEEPDNWQD